MYLILVTQDDHRAQHVELLLQPTQEDLDGGLRPGATRERDGKPERIVHVEYTPDLILGSRRAEWLKTDQGRQALAKAIEADARGECACDELIAGPPDAALS